MLLAHAVQLLSGTHCTLVFVQYFSTYSNLVFNSLLVNWHSSSFLPMSSGAQVHASCTHAAKAHYLCCRLCSTPGVYPPVPLPPSRLIPLRRFQHQWAAAVPPPRALPTSRPPQRVTRPTTPASYAFLAAAGRRARVKGSLWLLQLLECGEDQGELWQRGWPARWHWHAASPPSGQLC